MKTTLCFMLALLTFVTSTFVPMIATAQSVKIPEPVYPPAAVREAFDLDPFYVQWIDVEGLPVVTSAKVNPYAVKEAAWLIRQMIGHRQDVLQALVKNNVRFAVMAHNELTTQIPEHSDLQPDYYWDRRARGLGSTPERPATSCGEENLLNYPSDPYWNENILIHEFSHAIHLMGLNTVDPDFDDRLETTYNATKEKGLWKDTYAITNKAEYWAEGTQSWFDTNRANDSVHNHVDTRDKLKEYDPSLAVLLTEVYGDTDWRYTQAVTRTHLSHLQGFNPEVSPKFEWPPELIELTELHQQLKNPNSDGGGKWVNLKEHDPNLLPHLIRSADDDTETTIIFVNGTKAEIAYYRVDGEGNEKFYGWIAPDTFVNQDTYAGHIWIVKDLNGGNLVVFRAEKKTGRALVISASRMASNIITISEIMVASNGGRLPQWIELSNLSDTHTQNLKNWKLEIQNRQSADFNGHLNVTLNLKDRKIKPQKTLLIVSKQGRSSDNFPKAQVYNLNELPPDLGDIVLNEKGFYLKLSNKAGKLVDEVGNLDGKRDTDDKPTWPLPTSVIEDSARTSMIRRYDSEVPRLGTEETGWVSAENTSLLAGTTTYYGHPDDIGAPGVRSGGALPVTLSHFRAEHTDAGVVLKWTTESELDNAGFYIHRSETKNGEFKVVNPTMIQGAGTTSERNEYTWKDTTAKPNVAYYYRIEDISHAGVRKQLATVHMRGFVSATGKLTTRWADLKTQN